MNLEQTLDAMGFPRVANPSNVRDSEYYVPSMPMDGWLYPRVPFLCKVVKSNNCKRGRLAMKSVRRRKVYTPRNLFLPTSL